MYHSRFKGSHYDAGYKLGSLLYKNNNIISNNHTFVITEERKRFAKECIPIYEKIYPEILQEIKGIADGQKDSYENLCTFLLSMYCFEFNNKCTCFAYKDEKDIIFGRNSDFLVELEKLYMNCLYKLDNVYAFNGNTTAFVQMEDGVNEYGLAIGLTFVYPKVRKAGFNSGMLVRYLLEKCKTTDEALEKLKKIPIASQQTLTLADSKGNLAIVECNCNHIQLIKPSNDGEFVATANNFNSNEMFEYRNCGIDDWRSDERYSVAYNTLKENKNNFSLELAKDILSGKYGFMCQYNRKTGADTVWSIIYDLKNKKIYRVEGNPSRKKFKEDLRMKFV
ncbi:C45 family peptidase [uncultured Clostridium sp.]|uniref:C45 family peptidase n=1 Tax=uncultured Clostridium sp. TaxID=59620 RepID=UPI00262012DC|nr:C45 family peptidase [uncultured Clostridium sp.]MCI8310107.1 linear amide C-N hydrolase [Clostridia bacterium]